MTRVTQFSRRIATVLFALLLTAWAGIVYGETSNPWKALPTQVMNIEGGTVTFQGMVLVDARKEILNPIFEDYPTKYMLPVTNKSTAPIWVSAEWHVPGEKSFYSFGRLKPDEFGEFYYKVKHIVWNKPIPIQVIVYADENKSRKLGNKEIVLQFREEDKDIFQKAAKKINSLSEKMAIAHGRNPKIPILSGF